MKATEQYFSVVLFIMLYKAFINLILWMLPFNVTFKWKLESQYSKRAVPSCGAV